MTEKVFEAPRIKVPRRYAQGDMIEIRVKVAHNSTTGLGIDDDGNYFAKEQPYYINDMQVFYGDDMVSQYEMTSATSPNPLIRFKLIVDKEATLRVVMTNSDGITKEGSADVKFS